ASFGGSATPSEATVPRFGGGNAAASPPPNAFRRCRQGARCLQKTTGSARSRPFSCRPCRLGGRQHLFVKTHAVRYAAESFRFLLKILHRKYVFANYSYICLCKSFRNTPACGRATE